MDLGTLKTLASQHRGRLIGDPQPVDLSVHCPLFAFICPVALPEGCSPPAGRLPMRIGAGAAPSSDWARTLCMFEAIERYSLQHQTGDPETAKAGGLSTSTVDQMPTRLLMLGHPAAGAGVVDSRGCSIGRNYVDAAVRGMLELIERDDVEAWRVGDIRRARLIDLPTSSWLDGIVRWLESLGRSLNLLQLQHPSGASTFLSICCDTGGAKPVWGSATGFDPAQTLTRACVESVVSWRNLMAIDLNGLMDEDLPPVHAELLRIYRGQEPMPDWQIDVVGAFPDQRDKTPSDPSEERLQRNLNDLLQATDYPVSIFDLTREDVAIPVVRVVKQLV